MNFAIASNPKITKCPVSAEIREAQAETEVGPAPSAGRAGAEPSARLESAHPAPWSSRSGNGSHLAVPKKPRSMEARGCERARAAGTRGYLTTPPRPPPPRAPRLRAMWPRAAARAAASTVLGVVSFRPGVSSAPPSAARALGGRLGLE